MVNLKQLIENNWNGREFNKIAANGNLRNEIERKTVFLDSY